MKTSTSEHFGILRLYNVYGELHINFKRPLYSAAVQISGIVSGRMWVWDPGFHD